MAKTRIVTTRSVRVDGELTFADLAKLVRAQVGVPAGASVRLYVDVPGGGDWSNTDLDVEDHPVKFTVEWTESRQDDGR